MPIDRLIPIHSKIHTIQHPCTRAMSTFELLDVFPADEKISLSQLFPVSTNCLTPGGTRREMAMLEQKRVPKKISWKLDQRTFPILDDTSLLSLQLLLKGDGIIWGLINKSMNWGLINQRCILFTLRNKASWMISDQIITTSPRPHPEWWFSKAILYFKPRLVL